MMENATLDESMRGTAGAPACGFRAVLFDMDGVLVDSEEQIAQAGVEMFRERYGAAVTREDFLPFVGAGENRFIGGVAEKYGIRLDLEPDKALLYGNYARLAREGMRILPGALEYPRACKRAGLRIALASAADRVKVLVNLEALGIGEDFFDALVTGQDIERKKPFPDIYIEAARRIGVDPADCLVVEDAVNGLKAGTAAGARCLGITSTFGEDVLREAGASWCAPDLASAPLPADIR